ncbi:putative ribosomal protein S17e [Helianthus anomalus]
MTLDFHTNNKILEEVAIIPSKLLQNKIAGFSTHLMKRIQKGPVRGISLKLQEEEREREAIEADKETIELLASLGMSEMPGIVLNEDTLVVSGGIPGGYGGGRGGRRY